MVAADSLSAMFGRRFAKAVNAYAGVPAGKLAAALTEGLRAAPHCAVTRYLAGIHAFDRGRPAMGVRHLMIAHHAEPQLESAALLVFAGLNWIAQKDRPLLPVLLETWEEFRRPEFDRRPRERELLNAFAEPTPELAQLSPLAPRLWRLPIKTLRAQLRQAAQTNDVGLFPVLTATA